MKIQEKRTYSDYIGAKNRAYNAEKFVAKLLENSQLLNENWSDTKSYDIDWGGLKIDVKSSATNRIKGKTDKWWEFTLRKSVTSKAKQEADLYALVGYLNERPYKVFLIPRELAPSVWLRIHPNGQSSYNKYTIWKEYN